MGRGLCPSCGQKRAIGWAERMVEEVLPLVPYRQLVFTIPRNLRRAFLRDRSLYGELCRVAYASTRDFLRERACATIPKSQKAVPAMIVSPQSFGDILVAHAHAHAIVSLGLFTRDGVYHPMEDLDFSGLEETFRERFFRMMLWRGKITPETIEIMKGWDHSGFNIGRETKIETWDRKGLEGLLSYMERAPVSLRRLTYRQDDGLVHYQGTKVHPRLGTDHQLLPALDFLALLVPHIALRYEVTIRSYGALIPARGVGARRRRPREVQEHEAINGIDDVEAAIVVRVGGIETSDFVLTQEEVIQRHHHIVDFNVPRPFDLAALEPDRRSAISGNGYPLDSGSGSSGAGPLPRRWGIEPSAIRTLLAGLQSPSRPLWREAGDGGPSHSHAALTGVLRLGDQPE